MSSIQKVILFCLSILALALLIKSTPNVFPSGFFKLGEDEIHLLNRLFKNVIIISLSWIGIYKLALNNFAGLNSDKPWTDIHLVFVPSYLFLFGIFQWDSLDLNKVDLWSVVILVGYCLSTGFSEELLFRGLINSLLLQKFFNLKNGVIKCILASSFAFGLVHLFKFDKGVVGELTQVIYAFFYGVFYGAILLRTNKIIPIAILHGLNNFIFQFDLLSTETTEAVIESQGLVSQLTGAMFMTLLTLPLFIVGLYHLRIIEREKQKTNLI